MIKSVTCPLWQWSTGRLVKLEPSAGTTIDEVHFYNGTTPNALNGVIKEDGGDKVAEIPNIFLQSANDIVVYVVMVDDTGKKTTESSVLNVNPRPKPDSYVYTETEVLTWEKFDERLKKLEDGVATSAWLSEVSLLSDKWEGKDGLYSQVVNIDGITPYSKVDLLPSVEQLAIFHNKDVAFVTENENGVVTVFAIGDKPTQDYTMQVSITEVEV